MSSVNRARLVTKEFVAVTLATGAFFVYIGMFVPLLPRFIEEELGAGELGIGLSVAMFALAAILVRPVIARLIDQTATPLPDRESPEQRGAAHG